MDISIPARKIPVLHECEVLVCGGGCSGVAAAVSAARHGCEVALLERWPSVGGMATNGLVNAWHRSDREKVVIDGLVEESAARAAKEGWIEKDPRYPLAHETHWFEPEGMRIVWQRMLDEAKVRTFCHLNAGEPIVEGGRVRGVFVDTKRGRRALLAKIVVDATGDGDVAANAGLTFEYGRQADGLVQGMTLIFSLFGVDEVKIRSEPEAVSKALEGMFELIDKGQMPPINKGNARGSFGYWGAANHMLWNVCPVAGNPLDEEELSRINALSREYIVKYLEFWRAKVPGMAKAQLDKTAFAMGVRESRRVDGLKRLSAEMVLSGSKHSDAIGHGVWMIDIHDPKGSGYTTHTAQRKADMLPKGLSYHIPLGMCLNAAIPNLAVAGRCACSTHEAHSSVRVQTHCMVMGQGVGTAAAMALSSGTEMGKVDIKKLQAKLKADGVYIEDLPE